MSHKASGVPAAGARKTTEPSFIFKTGWFSSQLWVTQISQLDQVIILLQARLSY